MTLKTSVTIFIVLEDVRTLVFLLLPVTIIKCQTENNIKLNKKSTVPTSVVSVVINGNLCPRNKFSRCKLS